MLVSVLAACRQLPPEPLVSKLQIDGISEHRDEIAEGLATSETPLLFGFIPRVLEYATYDPNVLARDLLRIERALRARGYYEAKVVSARVVHHDHSVRIYIRIQQGAVVRVARIDPGLSTLPFDVMRVANRAREMAEGDILDEAAMEADRHRIELALREVGYAFCKVEVKASVDLPTHSAHVSYTLSAGPSARYGPITIVGLQEIPEGPVRDNLDLHPGEPYSQSELDDAERALINLGVFSTVEVLPDLAQPETGVVPITVRVRENLLRNLRLGGGVHFDVLRLGANLVAGWEHRNFLGGMRHLSLKAGPGVTLFPTRVSRIQAWTAYLPESSLSAELSQPSFLEGRTTGVLTASYNVKPLLYPLEKDADPRKERVIGYHEVSGSARLERAFFNHHLQVVPSYNWQGRFPFSYQGKQPDLDSVEISFPALLATFAVLDNPLTPHSGFSISSSFEVAGHGFGGTVNDVRIAPEAKGYLPIGKSVLAVRLGFGFLLPSGYGHIGFHPDVVAAENEAHPEDADANNRALRNDQQKLLFRAFYSGGPNSNRGYPYRGVGRHGELGFLVNTGTDCALNPNANGCIRPLGGLTLWEASLEARIPLPIDPLGIVLFVDASDLTTGVADLRTNAPHLSPGFGLRYLTPVGPLRFDVGWRVPGLQGSKDESLPGDELFGFFPGAIHLTLFEAF